MIGTAHTCPESGALMKPAPVEPDDGFSADTGKLEALHGVMWLESKIAVDPVRASDCY
jgi:hypothetical protein